MMETNEMIAMIIACASCIGKDVEEHGEAENVYIDEDGMAVEVSFKDDVWIRYYTIKNGGCYSIIREEE